MLNTLKHVKPKDFAKLYLDVVQAPKINRLKIRRLFLLVLKIKVSTILTTQNIFELFFFRSTISERTYSESSDAPDPKCRSKTKKS